MPSKRSASLFALMVQAELLRVGYKVQLATTATTTTIFVTDGDGKTVSRLVSTSEEASLEDFARSIRAELGEPPFSGRA